MAKTSTYYDMSLQIDKTQSSYYDLAITRTYEKSSYFDVSVSYPHANDDYIRLNASINASTLADTYNLESAKRYNLNDTVSFKVLDKDCKFKIASVNRNFSGGSYRYSGRYDSDKLMYRYLSFYYSPRRYSYTQNNKTHTVRYAYASDIAKSLANSLGLKLVYNAIDFIPSQTVYHVDTADKAEPTKFDGTYQSILSNIFGWVSSKLPNHTINVFIDNNTLYVVERGKEEHTYNLEDFSILYDATIDEHIIKIMWGGVSSNMPVHTDTEDAEPFTGVIMFGDAKSVYNNGYLLQETHGNTTTYYEYDNIDKDSDDKYLVKRLTVEIVSQYALNNNSVGELNKSGRVSMTQYEYTKTATELYQSKETERTGGEYDRTVYRSSFSASELERLNAENAQMTVSDAIDDILRFTDFSDAEKYVTRTVPLGNGWYGSSRYSVDGKEENLESTNLFQGAPGSKISQYTVNKANTALSDKQLIAQSLYTITRLLLNGYTFFDSTLPIAVINNSLGLGTASYLSQEINKLNNSVESSINCTIVNAKHVFNCNDCFIYNNHKYSVVSNNITRDAGGIKQSLQLVGWYK